MSYFFFLSHLADYFLVPHLSCHTCDTSYTVFICCVVVFCCYLMKISINKSCITLNKTTLDHTAEQDGQLLFHDEHLQQSEAGELDLNKTFQVILELKCSRNRAVNIHAVYLLNERCYIKGTLGKEMYYSCEKATDRSCGKLSA